MQEQLQPCALRALTLCDGQVLEEPDGALHDCPCARISAAERMLPLATQERLRKQRQELIERTMAAPPLPLPPGRS